MIWQVFKPILQLVAYERWANYELWEKVYKLRVIREFYPQFKNVSYDEINRTYGIDYLYNSVGKSYRRNNQYS
jgi:hypothetical protein